MDDREPGGELIYRRLTFGGSGVEGVCHRFKEPFSRGTMCRFMTETGHGLC